MTVAYLCDYCGEAIGDGVSRIEINAAGTYRGRPANWHLGHYHGDGCFDEAHGALKLVQSWGPTLEAIPTATGQAIAAKRRKHRLPQADR